MIYQNSKNVIMQKICSTFSCTNSAIKSRNYCNTCKCRKYDLKNPLRRMYRNLKSSAKRRNVGFELSFEEYVDFINENPKYLLLRGQKKNDLTIDRKKETDPYRRDTIQILKRKDNTIKSNKFRSKLKDEDYPF